jgi:HK97 family phage portal protein
MNFIDRLLGRNTKATQIANARMDLPLPQTMRGTSFFSGIGMQDLFGNLSRRLPNSTKDWTLICGDLMLNSIVAISLDFFIRSFAEARPMVYRLVPGSDSEYEKYPEHPILALLANPQPNLAPSRFWANVITDYKIYGNAYIRKLRSSTNGPVIGLQFLPSQQVQPVGNNTEPIVAYNYVVDGNPYAIRPDDIIHIAYLRDPEDYRLGRSPLMSCLREVATDNVASSTAYGLMKNSGMPSLMVGPDASDQTVDISDDDLRTLKKRLQDSFTNENSGSIAVMSGPFKLEKISHSPSDMALDTVRHTPEERITSALGLNCLVLNLSAGLQNSTYSNLQEATQSAWNNGVIPLLRVFSESITQNLLDEYPESVYGDYFDWDLSEISALKEDDYQEAKKAELLFKAGIIDRAEAKRMIGHEYNPTDEQIYHPDSVPIFIPTQNPNKSFDEIEVKKKTNYRPTDAMVNNARRALRWKDDGEDGGTIIGLTRANQIVNKENLSEETVVRMFSFFSRHEVDKKADGFYSGQEGYPSNGRVAWDLWGGDAGFSWSRNIVQKLKDDE